MQRLALLLALLLVLPACQTTEEAAGAVDTAVDATTGAAEDAAEATADVVTDAAGAVYNTAADVFGGDSEAVAVAIVRPTTATGARAQGVVRFAPDGDGLAVRVSLRGLSPGEHGLHIHQNPACGPADADGDGRSDPAGAAGGHWDPVGTDDHGAPTSPLSDRHIGDLGNVTVGAEGTVETTVAVSDFDLDAYPVAGHAVVVHGGRDDLETDPSGDSGRPQGCGVIEARM